MDIWMKEILIKMADNIDNKQPNTFDHFFFTGVPAQLIEKLETEGYIYRKNDIISSVELTAKGYSEARKK